MTEMIYDETNESTPVQDAENYQGKNRAKVGSARPSSLLYTYGPGSIMDLPNFSIMPTGLDAWDKVYEKLTKPPVVSEPRLLKVVQLHLGKQVAQLRGYPWIPDTNMLSTEGNNVGVPATVFPQWLRCTDCDLLAPLTNFHYKNENPFKPYEAQFTHKDCYGRPSKASASPKNNRGRKSSPAVPAPILLTCENGHLDEFPYLQWVHRGGTCSAATTPTLKMRESNMGKNISSTIVCTSCKQSRSIAEAQSPKKREVLPQKCRGRHPHLAAFDSDCKAEPTLILMGSSNLWFPVTQSVIVMPRKAEERRQALLDRLIAAVGKDELLEEIDDPKYIQKTVRREGIDEPLEAIIAALEEFKNLSTDPTEAEETERQENLQKWEPTDLLVPEWNYLKDFNGSSRAVNNDGLMLTPKPDIDGVLDTTISKVIGVDKLKKVNAVLGFTRLDEIERTDNRSQRMVKLTRNGKPTWVPAVEDRGEGVYLQFDLEKVATWEAEIEETQLWQRHLEAHERNFNNRLSGRNQNENHLDRFPPARYWLLHSLSHALMRQMAMESGYGAASLSERIYAWKADDAKEREAAAGILICTTASDSEGTLGGLVALSDPHRLSDIFTRALYRSCRCSSDPVCASRVPRDPEDFLHGAACHNCSFASETSCERSNRFLDRRFMLTLPGLGENQVKGFFGDADAHL